MRDIAELDFNKVATGDTKPNAWTLLDFGRFYYLPLVFTVAFMLQFYS